MPRWSIPSPRALRRWRLPTRQRAAARWPIAARRDDSPPVHRAWTPAGGADPLDPRAGAGHGGLLMFALAATAVRAVSLQVIQRARLASMATDQTVREMEIPARRGDIYDRRGIPLAQSVEVDSLWLDPSMVADLRRAARDLARTLHLDAADLEARLSRGRRFAWVKRQVTPQEVDAAQRLEIPGLGVAKEPKRFYPQRELGAQVLGVVGTDGHGLEGLELAF